MKVKSESEVAQSCPTLSDPMDCSLPGSSICGIFQARVLEWGAIAFSKFQLNNSIFPSKGFRTKHSFSRQIYPSSGIRAVYCLSTNQLISHFKKQRDFPGSTVDGSHLPRQGTQVWSLVWGIPHVSENLGPWPTTSEPTLWSPQVTTTESTCCNYWSLHTKGVQNELPKGEAREPKPESGPCSLQLEQARTGQRRSSTAKNKQKAGRNKKKYSEKKEILHVPQPRSQTKDVEFLSI